MDNGHNLQARQLAVQLCRIYLVEEKSRNIVTEVDFSNTLETLTRVYQSRQNSEGYAFHIFFVVAQFYIFVNSIYMEINK